MSSNHFQNNRVVHRNATSAVQIGIDTQSSINKTNDKLDLALTQQTAVNTKLDNLSGAINNNIGDGTVKLQTYVYAHDVSNGLSRPLKCDAAGRLECSVDALEITADTINLSTDQLEAKVDAVTSKLDSFAGAGNNNVGEGSSKLQTYLYARDVSAGNFKPLVCDGDAHLQIDCLSSALPSGAATQATLNDAEVHLGSIDGKITACNTGAVVVSGSALPSGAATAAHQATQNTALSEIEGAVENLELTVGTNAATAPTRSLQIGGKYVDGTFRDIKVDNIGKVIIDTPTGSDLDARLATIGTNTTGLAGCVTGTELQVDVVSMPTTAVTLAGGATEAKQDVIETTLNAIQSAVEGTLATTSAATLQTGSATIGKLAANSGIDIGDVDVTSLPLTFNSGNKDATCQRIVIATDDVNMSAIKSSLDSLDNAVDGNYLNVNANIAGTDVDSNSGNKSAATQRVVIADDDTNLSAIKTAVQILDNAIDGTEMRCDIIASLPAGTNAIGKLSANSGVDIGDVDVTSLPLTFNSGNKDATCQRVVVATDDVNLSAIKSSLDNLDNAVDGNYLNVNANIAGTDVDSNSGNKSAATQRVVIADDDVNLSAIKTAVELLDDCIGTDNSTGPAKCISIGATNLLGGAIQEIACDGDGHLQIDVLSSALPSGAAGEISNTVIATKATLATSSEVKELLSGVTVNAGALSSEFDTENYERVRFFGETTASTGTDIIFMGSNTSGGTFYVLGENLRSETISSTHYVYASGTENLPRFIKILNKSASTNYVFTKLYLQGSGGRLAV